MPGGPSNKLSRSLEPGHADLWDALRSLLGHLEEVVDRDAFIVDCLDHLVELLDADRGMVVLVGDDGERSVVRARGKRGDLSEQEQQEISATLIESALKGGKTSIWSGEKQPSTASMVRFGIWIAIAIPLRTGGEPLGVLYIDLRKPTKFLGERHKEFVDAAAVLTAVVLRLSQRLEATKERLAQARARPAESQRLPAIDDLLAFDSMAEVREELQLAAQSDMPILITGESGTGKTLIARALAEATSRRPIVRAVLGFSDDLNTISSELFGHLRGAYSGASTKREGLVEYADGGVLILDEVLNLPIHAQQLLLDFTQFGTYRPLGYAGAQPKSSDVRLIAATNGDLRAAIEQKRFREDLYYRLSAIHIRLPPLRRRRADIPTLAEQLLAQLDGAGAWTLSDALQVELTSRELTWPGNVRQLERVVQRARDRARLRSDGSVIDVEHADLRDARPVGDAPDAEPSDDGDLATAWERLLDDQIELQDRETELIRRALLENEGVVARAARTLGVARTTLSGRMKALGLTGVGRKR